MPKHHASPFRTYRASQATDLTAFQVIIEETDLWIAARTDLSSAVAEYVRELRGQIRAYALVHPDFLGSLKPLAADSRAPEIIQRMCQATRLFHVGPMAAVAGTIAQMIGEKFQNQSPDMLIENGGDTYLCSTRDRLIGLLPTPEENMRLGVTVLAQEFPCSFCASSAKIGHSLSFGNADLVVTRARDAALADAAATALANMLRIPADMNRVLEQAKDWADRGLEGVLAQCADKIGAWGKMELSVV